MDDTTASKKYKVLEFAEAHPYVLLGTILMLIVIILIICFGNRVPVLSGLCKRRKESLEDEDEMDKLIESIHNKQKKKK